MPHRYFMDATYAGGKTAELAPGKWQPGVPAELRYPLDVLEQALPQVRASGLHIYFTKNAYALPEYGDHVIAVLLQEERCKVPIYGRHVRATIRNLSSIPFLGYRPHLHMGRTEAVLSIEYARDWYTHTKAVRAQGKAKHSWPSPLVRRDPVLIRLPLGYHSQEELPQVHMADRSLDLFFAGQISHPLPRNDLRYWVSTSKFQARKQLWRELGRLKTSARWNLDLGEIASTDATQNTLAFNNYSEKMMNTRICVAPRGSVADTFRSFEGLRAGCLVVANRLPRERFLLHSPILQIDHWRELESILSKYARNIDLLEEERAKSLAWWDTHLTPGAVGRYLAEALNEAERGLNARNSA